MIKFLLFLLALISFSLLPTPSSASSTPCTVLQSSEKLMLQNCSGVTVLTLQGTPEERSFMHGQLIGHPLDPSVFHYFSEKAFDPVANAPAPIQYIFKKFYNLVVRYMHRSTPTYFKTEMNEMARGMNRNLIEVERAILLPDIGAIINRLSGFRFLKFLPEVGCTSVAQFNPAKNEFTYGRNLDFASTGLWDAHPLVTVHIPPANSKELKHIAFGAPGVQYSGITGVNEAGITFSVHQNYSTDVNLGGIPMFFLGEIVLRSAHSLEEAVEVLRKNRPGPLWTFVLSDLKTNQILAVETSKENFSVRKMEGNTFAQTNHIHDYAIHNWEFITVGTLHNSLYRYELALHLAKNIRAQDNSAEKIAAILATQKSKNGELSAHQDILKAHTIQTLIFHKAQKNHEVFVSVDPAPTASGRYIRFSLPDLWANQGGLPHEITKLSNANGATRKNQMAFAKSFTAYFDEHNDAKAYEFVRTQKSADAELLKAILLYRQKKYSESLQELASLSPACEKQEPLYLCQSLRFVKMLAHLKLEQKDVAKIIAQEILSKDVENKKIRGIAKRVIRDKTISSASMNLGFEFFSGDLSGHPN